MYQDMYYRACWDMRNKSLTTMKEYDFKDIRIISAVDNYGNEVDLDKVETDQTCIYINDDRFPDDEVFKVLFEYCYKSDLF